MLVSEDPLTVQQIVNLVDSEQTSEAQVSSQVQQALEMLDRRDNERPYELVQVGSGFRLQIRSELNEWVKRLTSQRPRKYSRSVLETLALIAYKQPVTRGEIEKVRGVAVHTQTIRLLLDRGWIKELGVREGPGRPMTYGTTKSFLDYFSLRSLDELPPLAEVSQRQLNINVEEGESEVPRRGIINPSEMESDPNRQSNAD